MKILFLDIDGVLNSLRFYKARAANYDKNQWRNEDLDAFSIQCLNEIIARTGAKIVISSTWRIPYSVEEIIDILERQGFKGEIIGKTPRLHFQESVRGDEIAAWLESQQEVIESFVILDDSSDMGHLMHRLVHCDHNMGLCKPEVEKAVKMLNGDG